ncbi:MAG TPA: sugar phosphate nucleotidyltransferase [Polyangiaceae bacterium]|nr:sugar phosphate nucleotidyltransferase [Polyangiaceae bacterium]
MSSRQRTWALVLAAGDGTRLATLTTDANGRAVPKQFCSLDGGHSLLDEAVQRGRRIVPRERLCVIVAADHRRFWQPALWALPSGNVIVQPRNCGTANGILLAVLRILERDPLARIVFLPADHYVSDEVGLGRSVHAAVTLLTRHPRSPVLVGIEPEEADPELGYIVPGRALADGAHSVARFVEKPERRLARALLANGALWNSFIFAASGPTLVGMMRERMPELVESMATALARESRSGARSEALDELYQELPPVDFSRAVLQGAEDKLRVVKAPACGWSDLGTPKRVADTLKRIEHERLERPRAASRTPSSTFAPAIISLAAQHARLGLAG